MSRTVWTTNVCFHGVGTPGKTVPADESAYWVSMDTFHQMLDVLQENPSVGVSFDDGNLSDVTVALPALRERGMVATFYLLAGRIGEASSVSSEGIRELEAAGMTIGSHGYAHRAWRGLDEEGAHLEWVVAREILQESATAQLDLAACPLGSYDRQVLRGLQRLGYRAIATSDRAPARRGAWIQPRYSVRAGDDSAVVTSFMDEGVRWLPRAEGLARSAVKARR